MTTLLNRSHLSKLIQTSQQHHFNHQLDLKRVGTIILGGGQGSRLFPLTKWRCKPAMSFGGRYRLIDIPISNSINSGCHKISIITQFLSKSLHQHIFKTYRLDPFSSGFIDILSAEERPKNRNWFQGTADAVRQNLDYFRESSVDYFFILSGDQLYNMDLQQMLYFARDTDADLVIASLPVDETHAKRMGILKIDDHKWITDFHEKPQDQLALEALSLSYKQREGLGIHSEKNSYLGSMGIYLFKREALFELLLSDPREDFGKHLIPTKVGQGNVATFIFHGYWEDIGTIDSFYRANLALTQLNPVFNCHNEERPIFTNPSNLPGAKIDSTHLTNAIVCDGSLIQAAEITNSILGPRTFIKKGSIIRDSYIIGNDFFASPGHNTCFPESFQIGENCLIQNAIIDRHVSIGKNVQLVNKNKLSHYDSDHIYIRDGIIVVSQGASIPNDFIL